MDVLTDALVVENSALLMEHFPLAPQPKALYKLPKAKSQARAGAPLAAADLAELEKYCETCIYTFEGALSVLEVGYVCILFGVGPAGEQTHEKCHVKVFFFADLHEIFVTNLVKAISRSYRVAVASA
jgi:hypothetical protein